MQQFAHWKENFKQSSGHTVKDVSALMRFEQVRNQLWVYPDTNIAGQAMSWAIQINPPKQGIQTLQRHYAGCIRPKSKESETGAGSDFVAFVQA